MEDYSINISVKKNSNIPNDLAEIVNFHFSHYKSMETLRIQEFKNLFFGNIGHWPKITNIYKYYIHTESDMVINSYL